MQSHNTPVKSDAEQGIAVISVLLILVPAFYFGGHGQTTEMGLSIVAGALSAGFLHFDKIKILKGGGFELQRMVDETNNKLEELRNLAKPLIEAIFNLTLHKNNIINPPDTFQIVLDLKKLSTKFNLQHEPSISASIEYGFKLESNRRYTKFVESAAKGMHPLEAESAREFLNKLHYNSHVLNIPRERILDTLENLHISLSHEAKSYLDKYEELPSLQH